MMTKILVPVADGTEELEAVTLIDVLRRAGGDVTIASVDSLKIRTSHGIPIICDKLIGDCVDETYDLIVLPGGMPGATHLGDSPELITMLRKQKSGGRWFGAVCASPAVVLLNHGLLTNLQFTCYPGFRNDVPEDQYENKPVVISGNCVTSQAPGTVMTFALTLTELLFGREKAMEVASGMAVLYEPIG